MTMNIGQKLALETVIKRYEDGEAYATIAGWAGTGKTYVTSKIIETLGLDESEYQVATFTGKAAQVQQQRGQRNAITLHKALYQSIKTKDGFIHRPFRVGVEHLEQIKMFIVDEVSMVPKPIIEQLLKHKIFCLFLGDKGQLPPVGEGNGILDHPHAVLTEIMRQADGNTIALWAEKVRQGRRFKWENDDFVKIVDQKDVVTGMYQWADQILCFTNATRHRINNEMRQIKGFTSPEPQEGDKMIAVRNNWERQNASGFSWVNGTIGTVSNVEVIANNGVIGNPMRLDFMPDYDDIPFFNVPVDGNPFYGYAPVDTAKAKGTKRPEILDFGYAITVHKSQGSEYNNVLLFEENWRIDQLVQILYTGGTRARLRLVVVRKPRGSFFL